MSNHHSLIPPSGRTSCSRSPNDFIHKSSIHCSSSQLLVPLLDCFYWVHIRLVILWFLLTGCSGFSFFLGIFMFFRMFFFSSWVHGVSYRFHNLEIPLLSFIIGSQMWMDNQGYFKATRRRRLLLRSNWTRTTFHGCYHGYILHHLQWIIELDPS